MKKTIFYLLISIVLLQPINTSRIKADNALGEKLMQPSSQSNIEPYIERNTDFIAINKDALLNQTNLSSYLTVFVTGYSSTPEETDDTPFITASGKYVRKGIVASNFLPLGTKIRLPDIFGDQIFVVEDRMNKKYSDKIDIWFEDQEEAQNFGIKISRIEIL